MYASYDTESSNLKHFGLLYQWGKSYTAMPHDASWYQSHMVESTDEIAYLEGRNADELFRKLQACQFVYEHGDEVCPAKWQPGAETLKPSLDLVGQL